MLTVEELKGLPVGDWIWVVNQNSNKGMYVQIEQEFNYATNVFERRFTGQDYYVYPKYQYYGKTWVAYKNKEEAEK